MSKGWTTSVVALGGAALLVAGGGAYTVAAVGSTPTGTISACVSHRGGAVYKAKHCKAHDVKLAWNTRGARGPRGPRGPIGPGATVYSWNATASASPQAQAIATVLGVTYYGQCADVGGSVVTEGLLKATKEVSWDGYIRNQLGGVHTVSVASIDIPAGAATTANIFTAAGANSGGDSGAQEFHVVQLKPSPGSVKLFLQATTLNSAETCHISVLYYPTGAVKTVGTATAAAAHARQVTRRSPLFTVFSK